LFQQIRFTEQERAYFKYRIVKLRETWASKRDEEVTSLNLRLSQIKDRLNRLTDAYLDGTLDKTMFEERKKSLFLEQKTTEENLTNVSHANRTSVDRVEKFLELAGNAWLSHKKALPEEKREMVEIFTSNRLLERKKIDLKPSLAFQDIANRFENPSCDLQQDIPRTWDKIIDTLAGLNSQGLLPDLSLIADVAKRKDATNLIDGQSDTNAMVK
jgi:hypothetical protein